MGSASREAPPGRRVDMTNDPARQLDRERALIRAEFVAIPGLKLTQCQVKRLWGLDDPGCTAVLGPLVAEHFLRVTPDGLYARERFDLVADEACLASGTRR
jgi:hypothetical protein